MPNSQTIERKWYVVDATDCVMGRLASQVASILSGKNKPTYAPHVDTGDYVIVINTDKIALTGKKLEQKMHRHHTGYIGNFKEENYKTFMNRSSDEAFKLAVKGMLPKSNLGREMLSKLKLIKDDKYDFKAQKPEVLVLKEVR
jgi:large subunit ribosomal protein L13